MRKYYHVRITLKSNQGYDELKTDLSEDELRQKIILPYENSNPIVLNGKFISSDNLDRIQISVTDSPIAELINQIQAEDRNSPVFFVTGLTDEWRAANRATNVTDNFIIDPPGYKSSKNPRLKQTKNAQNDDGASGRSDHPIWRIIVLLIVIAFAILIAYLSSVFIATFVIIFVVVILPLAIAGISHKGMEGKDYVTMYKEGVKSIPLIGKAINKDK